MSDESKRRKTDLLNIIVKEDSPLGKGIRVDQYLSALEEFPSRSQLKHWFEEGRVKRQGRPLKAGDWVRSGDSLSLEIPPEPSASVEARELPLEILFEDDSLIVLNKPRGLSMHPGSGRDDQTTLVHALLHHGAELSRLEGADHFRPGIVHRLDKWTEGLVVIAKSNKVHEFLSQQFSSRSIQRAYWALVWGDVREAFDLEWPIGRHPVHRKKMCVTDKGRYAKTLVFPKAVLPAAKKNESPVSWIECQLKTGRTHQIRVHLQHQNLPLLNDPVYGPRKAKVAEWVESEVLSGLEGQALVAFRLGFVHPVSAENLYFELDPPQWLKKFQNRLGLSEN